MGINCFMHKQKQKYNKILLSLSSDTYLSLKTTVNRKLGYTEQLMKWALAQKNWCTNKFLGGFFPNCSRILYWSWHERYSFATHWSWGTHVPDKSMSHFSFGKNVSLHFSRTYTIDISVHILKGCNHLMTDSIASGSNHITTLLIKFSERKIEVWMQHGLFY